MLKELLDCVATVDTRVVAVERKEVVLFFYTGVQGATVPKGIISSLSVAICQNTFPFLLVKHK